MLKKSMTMYIAQMVGYGIRLILPYFLVRILSTADFGAYRQFFLLQITISMIFQLGVVQALYYFIPRDEENSGAYFINSLLLNILVFSGAFTIIHTFGGVFSRALNVPLFTEYFWQLFFYVIPIMLIASIRAFLTAKQLIKTAAIFQVGGQIVRSVMTLAVALISKDLGTIFWSLAIASGISLIFMLLYVHFKLHGFRAKKYFFNVWTQLKYGAVLGTGGALWVLQPRIHEMIVSRYYGLEGYAIYSAGCTQIPIVDFYIQSVMVVSLGQFALLEKEGNWEGIRKLWDKILTSLIAITVPGVLFLLLISDLLISTMFTPEYAEAVEIFRMNTLVKLGFLWNSQLVLRAMDRNGVVFWCNAVVMAISPFALYWGMNWGGTIGIIGMQFFLVLVLRVGMLAVLNRISGHPLPYFVPIGNILEFYQVSWNKGFHILRNRFKGRA